MWCASSLTIVLNAIMLPGEECIAFTPYFPEYGVFIERTGAKHCCSSVRK